ncbi:MAG: primosomal protein N' [Eubacteriaceae bacterium]|nr:primosomal protein N' [Eubacteriaceae bacterium]
MSERYCEVIVDIAHSSIDHIYDYRVPEGLTDLPGHRVLVPFGRMDVEGIVLREKDSPGYDREKIKDIIRVLDDVRTVSEEQIRLAEYMCAKYRTTMSFALRFMFPSGVRKDRVSKKERRYVKAVSEEGLLEERRACYAKNGNVKYKRKLAYIDLLLETGEVPYDSSLSNVISGLSEKGIVTVFEKEIMRSPDTGRTAEKREISFTDEQAEAIRRIEEKTDKKENCTFLLHGVTGSGKTEVYIETVKHVLSMGRTAIVLVPEISITPQILREFSRHFTDEIAVFHSGLSDGERYDEWKRIRSGAAKLVIGTRSAVFAPVSDLGILIMDEEQEDTYKSENSPRYHARDVAKYLCAHAKALLVMGSATPDICSRYYAETGRYHLFRLPDRFNAMRMPEVRIADMKRELKQGNGTSISRLLRDEIRENLRREEQTILFLNRRGANKLVTCAECGYTYRCPNCSAALTYHSVGDRLICHYCGHSRRLDSACPDCGEKLSFVGVGTQKVVKELDELFPGVPVLRMDTDSVTPVGSHRTLFESFRSQRIPILVGTQMITKGLNFENVTLVGVLSADQSLYAADYRAGERTFSLITQVIGRSGRFEKPGRAVIQTFTPENQIIRQAAAQDYESFYEAEIGLRRVTGTPPFTDIFVLTAMGEDADAVQRCCVDVRSELMRLTRDIPEARVLGPAPLPVARVNRTWRYRVTLTCPEGKTVRPAVSRALMACNNNKKYRGVSLYADYNPLD